eukprot:m.184097 g.184097  ORF g.184097 m.184097 type:complete len:70 (+) comp10500_c0_seq4:124-333(+)
MQGSLHHCVAVRRQKEAGDKSTVQKKTTEPRRFTAFFGAVPANVLPPSTDATATALPGAALGAPPHVPD